MPVAGYLHIRSPESYTLMMAALREGLKQAGYIEGQNVVLEFPGGSPSPLAGTFTRRRTSSAARVGKRSDRPSAQRVRAAKQESATIPIVFVPVESGLVTNLNRPGGNLTGVSSFTIELGSKRLELLRELVPKSDTFAVLVDPQAVSPRRVPDQSCAMRHAQSINRLKCSVRAVNRKSTLHACCMDRDHFSRTRDHSL